MADAIVLLSGGLDSVVSAALARTQHRLALALTVDYGQRAYAREIAAAERFCRRWDVPHQVVALPWLANITTTALVNTNTPMPQYAIADLSNQEHQTHSAAAVWVPNRNGLFLNIAAAYAETHRAQWIVTGFNAEEAATFPDNTPTFVERANAYLEYATLVHPRVVSFTQAMTKREIVACARTLDLPLDWCWPCYEGGTELCGTCESCVRFQRAMTEAA